MMFHISHISTIFILTSFCTLTQEDGNANTLSAVTNFPDIAYLYRKIARKEPHLEPNTSTDDETRKEICLSVTKNPYFDLFVEEDPVENMAAIYDQLRTWAKETEEEEGQEDEYFERVLEDYQDREDGSKVFTYRSRLTPMIEGLKEYAFPCLTILRSSGNPFLYFISDPYNINAALDVPTSEPIQARFLCAASTRCEPWILAEEPAIAFAPPQYSIEALEETYLEIRKSRNEASIESADPLCGLTMSGKLRACATAMNSSCFADKVRFDPNPYLFSGECEFNQVSFVTNEVKKKANKQPYNEWMLPCTVSPFEGPREKEVDYFLSRAYQSHHAVVYAYNIKNDNWNIVNISSKISVIIDIPEEIWGTEEGSPPKMKDLLEKYQSLASEKIVSQ